MTIALDSVSEVLALRARAARVDAVPVVVPSARLAGRGLGTARRRPPGAGRRHRAIPLPELERLWARADVPLRERALWRLLYDSAGRPKKPSASTSATSTWATGVSRRHQERKSARPAVAGDLPVGQR